ncbi:Putative thiazole biosynthetic enzyme [Ascidiaceihabitans donghaensis]|uniref:Thiazole biosynthetic enzyme n=1 Tax=Ascidiaceihabitans donghaensis TaxID=1510460 RepID=A0A2R8BIX6_9RHOB|nr:TIGR03862 family flavoprotein [Ascidiaceihabitans donghaensis]SPH22982.1 Putative thiazole biosynthetic enzyme [Ascidiaceihabitans donghaensis]
MSVRASIIGGGPAGLMAAEVLAQAGAQVTVFDAKPSMGRKFLMAGKSGLNLTTDAPLERLLPRFYEAADRLEPMIADFDSKAIQAWAKRLQQPVFTGSSGRVFPEAMKASPLLRAWFARLDALGVRRVTRARWQGWDDAGALVFDPPQEAQFMQPDVTILALGGASWARLGSDGAWANMLKDRDVPVIPFGASNVGVSVDWSTHMQRHFGAPIKAVKWTVNGTHSRGEAVVSAHGLEGGGLYPLARHIDASTSLFVDLIPDMDAAQIAERLSKKRGKASLSNHLRKALRLSSVKIAMLQEWSRPVPQNAVALAALIKNLPVAHAGLRPMDQAISTHGGIAWNALDNGLMLKSMPGVFCAGEMVDWDAPTGGYLLTGCFATGRWAGQAAAQRLGLL